MVGGIYFIEMPYSDFKQSKGRAVLVFRVIDKNDKRFAKALFPLVAWPLLSL